VKEKKHVFKTLSSKSKKSKEVSKRR